MLLIDPPIWPAHGRRWSHLVSDTSLAELHAFASGEGIPVRGFEGDHYDIPEERYAQVVAAGAVPVSSRELLRRLQISGLRRPKRRGERVLASTLGTTGERVDVVLSGLEPLAPPTRSHLVLRCGTSVLVLDDGDEVFALPAADPPQTAAWLAEDLVGLPVGLRRLGYLRPEGRLRYVEPVLTGDVAGPPAPSQGRWIGTLEGAALLPAHLAPLVHGPFVAR